MTPECLTDEEVAELLGHKLEAFRKKRPALVADGFPQKHPILKRYFRSDVLAWVSNNRQVLETGVPSGSAEEEPDFDQV